MNNPHSSPVGGSKGAAFALSCVGERAMIDDEPSSEDNVIRLDWWHLSSGDPVERVARALCRYAGHDPDQLIATERVEPIMTQEGVTFERGVDEPAWKSYAEEAGRLVAAFEAFSRS